MNIITFYYRENYIYYLRLLSLQVLYLVIFFCYYVTVFIYMYICIYKLHAHSCTYRYIILNQVHTIFKCLLIMGINSLKRQNTKSLTWWAIIVVNWYPIFDLIFMNRFQLGFTTYLLECYKFNMKYNLYTANTHFHLHCWFHTQTISIITTWFYIQHE